MTLIEKVVFYNITMGENLNDVYNQVIAFVKSTNPNFGEKYEAYKMKQKLKATKESELELDLDLDLD